MTSRAAMDREGATTGEVALIDAGGANLGSVRYALERLGVSPRIARDADGLINATRVILPGVGAAAPAMALLRERGFDRALQQLEVPLLGICLGMQLLFESSDEGETGEGGSGEDAPGEDGRGVDRVDCLGLLPGRVRKLESSKGVRIPHMGWNSLRDIRPQSPLLAGIADGAETYFVHGYVAPVTGDCIATCTHGQPFAAVVQRGLISGVQFHPERSASVGARLLANFLGGEPR